MCIGSGACVLACPEVFALDDDGMVKLITGEPRVELELRVLDAIAACPATVISIETENIHAA